MAYYRATFPNATVTPKLHFLECHTVPWIEKWHMGFGLLGEQGAESIHAHFNSLRRTYQTMPDGVQRLHQMMREHQLHISPQNIIACPPTKKRPRKEGWCSCSSSCFILTVYILLLVSFCVLLHAILASAMPSLKKITTTWKQLHENNQCFYFLIVLTFFLGKLQLLKNIRHFVNSVETSVW